MRNTHIKLPVPYNNNFRTSPTLPTVSNGMLCFSDSNHVDDFIDYLDALSFSGNENEIDSLELDTLSFDDKLDIVESALGFESLRQKQNIAFELLNESGFHSPDDIPSSDFIPESSLRTILNEHRELQVGNSVYVFYNEKYTIEVKNASMEDLYGIRDYQAAVGSETLPPVTFVDSKFRLHPQGNERYFRTPAWQDTLHRPSPSPGNPKLRYRQILQATSSIPNCTVLTLEVRMRVATYDTLSRVVVDYVNSRVRYEIDWGDGSPVDTIIASTGGELTTRTRNYAASGTYTVSIVAYDDITGRRFAGGLLSQRLESSLGPCANRAQRREHVLFLNGNTDVYIYTMLYYRAKTAWHTPDSPRPKVTALSKSYIRKKNSSVYRHRKVNRLSLQCYFTFRRNGNCNEIVYNEFFSDWPHNQRKVEISKRLGRGDRAYTTDDVRCHHQLIHENLFSVHTNTLVACD